MLKKMSFSPTPQKGGTLIFGHAGDCVGLDPGFESDSFSLEICEHLLETLVFYGYDSTEVEPGLAQSWMISPDKKSYTFHLQDNVRFHDGTPLNADAVVFSLGRQMIDPKVKFFENQYELPKLDRSTEYWQMMGMDSIVESLEAINQQDVKINLKVVSSPFLATMAMTYTSIISPTAYLNGNFSNHPIGTGPFKFVEQKKAVHTIVKANEDYWDRHNGPFLDRIEFRVLKDSQLRFKELQAGKIHGCQYPDPGDIQISKMNPKLQLLEIPSANLGYVGFNHRKDLWKDNKKLRLSIAHATDIEKIIGECYQGTGIPAKAAYPPNMWGYNKEIPGYEYDLEQAKRLLAEAGYPDGKGLPELKFWCLTASRPYIPDGIKMYEIMEKDLAEIGIKCELVKHDWDTFLKNQCLQPDDMDLFQLGWNSDNGDPDNFLATLFDGLASPYVKNQWKNQEFHNLMILGRETVDEKIRTQIYEKAQILLFEECAAIPIAHSKMIWPASKEIMNYKLHPTRPLDMKSTWLQDAQKTR